MVGGSLHSGVADTTEHMGDSIWGEAAASFGEAVALELKAKVRPFASNDHIGLPMDSEGRVARQYVGWRRALRGQGMLGDMIECLLQARHPNHEAARALKVWLSEQQPDSRARSRPFSSASGLASLTYAPPSAPTPSPQKIGESGMGEVYRWLHRHIPRRCADGQSDLLRMRRKA